MARLRRIVRTRSGVGRSVRSAPSALYVYTAAKSKARLCSLYSNSQSGQVAVFTSGRVIHADQALGLVVRQRPQDHGVQHAEDGGVRADASASVAITIAATFFEPAIDA